jgi:hypothetical protein
LTKYFYQNCFCPCKLISQLKQHVSCLFAHLHGFAQESVQMQPIDFINLHGLDILDVQEVPVFIDLHICTPIGA